MNNIERQAAIDRILQKPTSAITPEEMRLLEQGIQDVLNPAQPVQAWPGIDPSVPAKVADAAADMRAEALMAKKGTWKDADADFMAAYIARRMQEGL